MNNFHGLTGISTKFKALISLLSASTMINLTPLNHADQVTDWNATLVAAMRTASDLPPVSARKAAIVQAAVYDAVNGITREFEPYFVSEWAPGGARPEAAAAQAAYTTLLEMYPGQKDLFDQQLATAFASIPGNEGHSESIERGVAWGNYVADQILEWRTQDGFSTPYPPFYGGTYIGEWRSIPNGTLPAILPSFRFMTPFTLLRADQFRPGPPPALTSAQYAADVNETEALGRKTGSTRTPEQTDLARLWAASALRKTSSRAPYCHPMRP